MHREEQAEPPGADVSVLLSPQARGSICSCQVGDGREASLSVLFVGPGEGHVC